MCTNIPLNKIIAIKTIIFFVLMFSLTGCSLIEPRKIPMQESYIKDLTYGTNINLIENTEGFSVRYFPPGNNTYFPTIKETVTEATLTLLTLNDTSPTHANAAKIGANRIFKEIKPAMLNEDLLNRLKTEWPSTQKAPIKSVSQINAETTTFPEGIIISVSYAMNVKAEILFVAAEANLYPKKTSNIDINHKSYSTIEPIYSNRFYYYSEIHTIPKKSKIEIENRRIQIQKEFINKRNKLPRNGTPEHAEMKRRMRMASLDYNLVEKTNLSLDAWLFNNATELKEEVSKAHQFIIEALYRDLFNFEPSTANQKSKILEVLDDGRVIKMIGGLKTSGQIESLPKSGIDEIRKLDFSEKSYLFFPDTDNAPNKPSKGQVPNTKLETIN